MGAREIWLVRHGESVANVIATAAQESGDVLVLRKDTVEHNHFRVWTAVPVLGVTSCVLLLTQREPLAWTFGCGFLALGAILFFIARATRRRAEHTSR